MVQRISALDPTESAPVLQMPVVFFIGRHDRVIAPETSVAYFNERESQTSPEHSGNPRLPPAAECGQIRLPPVMPRRFRTWGYEL
jgi:hypothetical protein